MSIHSINLKGLQNSTYICEPQRYITEQDYKAPHITDHVNTDSEAAVSKISLAVLRLAVVGSLRALGKSTRISFTAIAFNHARRDSVEIYSRAGDLLHNLVSSWSSYMIT